MQGILIDASLDDRIVIHRRDINGGISKETALVAGWGPVRSNSFYAIDPGIRLDEYLKLCGGDYDDEWQKMFEETLKQTPDIHIIEGTSDTPFRFLSNRSFATRATSPTPITGDGPEQLDVPLLVGSLVLDLAKERNMQFLLHAPAIFGRFHGFNPLVASGVEFGESISEDHRDYLHQIADLVNDGNAGLVIFTSPDAFTAPVLDVVLDLQAVRMLAGQIGLRMAQHRVDGGGVGELMTAREVAIRRATLEFILLCEIGEAELRVTGDGVYEIVSDVIRTVSHSAAEADAYLARYVSQACVAEGEDEGSVELEVVPKETPQPEPIAAGPKGRDDISEKPKADDPEAFIAVMAELDALVGLEAVKTEVHDLKCLAAFQKDLKQQRGKQERVSLHLVFTGNPGTGKTTVARLIGSIYKSLGLLQKGHLVEVGRSDLVGTHIGQTEKKAREVIEQAMDGVLFIDEAYALAVESPIDYGKEAIDVLLTKMENHADRLAVIVAGYPEEMDSFINSNPGLHSRFSSNPRFLFEDYNGEELTEIYRRLAEGGGYRMSEEVLEAVRQRYDRIYAKRDRTFGNGRVVRNDYQRTIKRLARRHVPGRPVDMEIRLEDIQSI
ncbi:MAG TPA: AAA family ATPase [Nitrosospira sp.]|nr:AAA family ATPase [Nitrosospira sp.]